MHRHSTHSFRLTLFAILSLSLLLVFPLAKAASPSNGVRTVTIRVEGDGWGSAPRAEIETLLHAVANELVRGASPVFTHPIVVTHRPGSPVVLYERGDHGEYRVHLSAQNRHWAQFAYQFGHELCHIMSNFDAPGRVRRPNQWFEEALCETAGLFALRNMARTWQGDAPYVSWEDYAPVLKAYADRLMAEPHQLIAQGLVPGRWLQANLDQLRQDPYLREHNAVVANLLLPLFERGPHHWQALQYLNLDDSSAQLPRYLAHWHQRVPAPHRPFIRDIAARLGLSDALARVEAAPAPTDASASSPRRAGAQAGSAGPTP